MPKILYLIWKAFIENVYVWTYWKNLENYEFFIILCVHIFVIFRKVNEDTFWANIPICSALKIVEAYVATFNLMQFPWWHYNIQTKLVLLLNEAYCNLTLELWNQNLIRLFLLLDNFFRISMKNVTQPNTFTINGYLILLSFKGKTYCIAHNNLM